MIVMHGISSVGNDYVLPEHCILLDYMTDGYHYGKQRNQSYADYPTKSGLIKPIQSETGSTYFTLAGSKFSDGIPFAIFDKYGTGGKVNINEKLIFSGLTKSNYPNGICIEFLMRIETPSASRPNGSQCFSYDQFNNFAGINSTSNRAGTYWWNGSGFSFESGVVSFQSIIGYDDLGRSWHHYAYTIDFVNKKHYMFVDGVCGRYSNNDKAGGNIYIEPCPIETNDGATKINSRFDMTQLVVWDYPKYTSGFTVPRTLVIDM